MCFQGDNVGARIFKTFIVGITFLLTLFYFSWVNISPHRLTQWLNYQGERLFPGNVTLQVKEARPTLFGLEVASLKLLRHQAEESVLEITDIECAFGPIDLLLFQEVSFRFKSYQGVGTGRFNLLKGARVSFKGEGISLNHHVLIRQTNLLNSNPTLDFKGDVDLNLPLSGTIRFEIKEALLKGDAKVSGVIFSLPDTDFKKISGTAKLEGQRVQLNVKTVGDISQQLRGEILLNRRRPMRSRINMALQARLRSDYKKKLNFLEPLLSPYTQPDGTLSVKVEGAVSFPEIKKL